MRNHNTSFRDLANIKPPKPKNFSSAKRVTDRMNDYWKDRVVPDFKPVTNERKKIELEILKDLRAGKQSRSQNFKRVNLFDLIHKDM